MSDRLDSCPARVVDLAFTPFKGTALAHVQELDLGRWGPAPISSYIRDHTSEADAVWSDPAARLLLETGRKPGSRVAHR